jgi:hypothetical protein
LALKSKELIMALAGRLYIKNFDGDPEEFVRRGNVGPVAEYVNVSSLGSSTIVGNLLRVRLTDKGSALVPNLQRKGYNINREMSLVGGDGKIYTGSVNLTVNLPGGAVLDVDAIKNMVYQTISFVTDFPTMDDPSGAGTADTVSESFLIAVRIQEV